MMMLKRADEAPSSQNAPRPAPHNIEAEQALLGAILIDNRAYERVVDIVASDDFFDALHGRIFETMASLLTAGKQVSMTVLKTFFENVEPIGEKMTVPQYLGRLAANATTTMMVRDYAELIVEFARRRQLIVIGEGLVHEAYDASTESPHASALIEDAEQNLFRIAEKSSGEGIVSFRELIDRNLKFANEAHRLKGNIGHLPTGLVDLDAKLGGFRKTDLIIIAARPSMGKTALATNIAYSIATKGFTDPETGVIESGVPIGFFSLEMSNEQLSLRVLAAEAEVPVFDIARGSTTPAQIADLMDAGNRIARTPVIIDDRGGIQIAQLVSRARRMKRRHNIGLLIVDYLQLLSGRGRRNDNRVQELTEITTALKALAKELRIPVVALSQLSRSVEGRDNKRPQLSDLRESGSIEQDADVVLFIYREEYYLERTKPNSDDLEAAADHEAKLKAAAGKAEIIIGKDRHGPGGTVDLAFEGRLTRFYNLARSDAAMAALEHRYG